MTIDQDTSSTDKLRVSRLDAILFLLSTAVILLSLWPTIGPRQSLSYTTGDGEVKHCVLPADDLRVQRLKKIWHDHQNLKPRSFRPLAGSRTLLTTTWREPPSPDRKRMGKIMFRLNWTQPKMPAANLRAGFSRKVRLLSSCPRPTSETTPNRVR